MRLARIISACVAGCFLAIHIVMLAMFTVYGVTPMMYFNIFSVVFFISMFFLINRGALNAFVVCTYLEIFAHMTLAVFYVGWDAGFQVTLIGLSALVFFAEYVERSLGKHSFTALPLCVVGMCAYLGIYVVGRFFPPLFPLPDDVNFWLQIMWGVITFVVNIAILYVFVLITFKSEIALSSKATHDQLTGLYNRYFMTDYLSGLISEDASDMPWVAMVDVDDFKKINDTYGHICGDEVLQGLVQVIATDGASLEASRWGGEEFLLAGRAQSAEEVRQSLEVMCASIAEHGFWYGENRLRITVTIGAAVYEPGDTVIGWINRADKNLYEGKRQGKNQVVM